MKNIFFVFVLACTMLAACKKDNKQPVKADNKLYTVKFTVNSFSQQHVKFQNNGVRPKTLNSVEIHSANDTITSPVLYYRVYDSTGTLVHSIYQDSLTTNFGSITDQLTAGTYTVVMIGGENEPYTNNGFKQLQMHSLLYNTDILADDQMYYYEANAGISQFFDETFLKKFTLTVGSNNVNQTITLTHIVGQLIVNIQDAVPANAQNIQLTIGSISYVYNLGTGLPDVKGDSGTMAYLVVPGVTNFKMYNYILNTTAPFSVTISAYSDGNVLIASKTIQNVSCAANQQVTLTGNLFGGTGNNISGDISATADTTWNSTTLNYHF